MSQNSFYNPEEVLQLGFKSVGENVLISRFARFYGIGNMEIGNNVRIDDFSILSGKIKHYMDNLELSWKITLGYLPGAHFLAQQMILAANI